MTCQNCHTPKGERGAPVFERDLSSGLILGRAAVQGDGLEHHAGQGDRHRQLERCRHQEGAAEGRAAERRAPRRDHAVGFLRDPHPRRPRRDRRLSAHREAGEAGDADAGLPHRAAAPHPAGRRQAVHRRRHGRQGEEGLLSRDHRALHRVPHADGAARARFRELLRQGRLRIPGPWGKSVSRNITSHKEKGIGAWSDAEIKRAITEGRAARTARRSSRRWATASTRT